MGEFPVWSPSSCDASIAWLQRELQAAEKEIARHS